MIFAYTMLITSKNPPVALGHKDHMATTRSVACDPTMSQGMWAMWACCSKDGYAIIKKTIETRGLVWFVSTADPLTACAGADRSTDIPDQGPQLHSMPGTRIARIAALQPGHFYFSWTVINPSWSVTLRGARDDDQRQHDITTAFAPDDARPDNLAAKVL